MKKLREITFLLFSLIFLSACLPQPTQAPGFIFTAVAGTQTAAAWQTESAMSLSKETPILATLRPTLTLQPTATGFVFVFTPSNTPTLVPSVTRTPRQRTEWPDWKTGSVIKMPSGSGANIGTNKKFSNLTGLMVIVVRRNGVALRSVPNKAIGGPMEDEGSAFTLTGVMNKNPEFGWLFAQVIAADGKEYWVGGSEGDENTDPNYSLKFYYP